MGNGAGGGARDRVRQADCAALRNDHAMSAGGQSRSNDGAEIVRIFDAVEKNDESFLTVIRGLVGCRENTFQCGWRAGGGQTDDALMVSRIGKTIELPAVFKANGDVAGACQLDDFF